MKILTFGLVLFAATTARAQTFPPTFVERAGCVFKASAYIDPDRLPGSKLNPASRFDLELFQPASDPYRWDYTLPGDSSGYSGSISGAFGSSYQTQKNATIRATLRQFDTCDERVTFKNLDLLPVSTARLGTLALPDGPRFLALAESRSFTTPSGITVTLLAQNGPQPEDFNAIYNGNIGALWVKIAVTPNTKLVSPLPDSPLFRRHGRAVSIKLEVPEPNLLVSYAADNTYTGLKIDFPKRQTATHLDELTLIVHQRVDLQTVPISFQVPISKPKSQKASVK